MKHTYFLLAAAIAALIPLAASADEAPKKPAPVPAVPAPVTPPAPSEEHEGDYVIEYGSEEIPPPRMWLDHDGTPMEKQTGKAPGSGRYPAGQIICAVVDIPPNSFVTMQSLSVAVVYPQTGEVTLAFSTGSAGFGDGAPTYQSGNCVSVELSPKRSEATVGFTFSDGSRSTVQLRLRSVNQKTGEVELDVELGAIEQLPEPPAPEPKERPAAPPPKRNLKDAVLNKDVT